MPNESGLASPLFGSPLIFAMPIVEVFIMVTGRNVDIHLALIDWCDAAFSPTGFAYARTVRQVRTSFADLFTSWAVGQQHRPTDRFRVDYSGAALSFSLVYSCDAICKTNQLDFTSAAPSPRWFIDHCLLKGSLSRWLAFLFFSGDSRQFGGRAAQNLQAVQVLCDCGLSSC